VGNPEVVSRYPSLIQAVDGIRSPQLRAMGTVGGELVQRPRCWYYRSGFGLLAMSEGRSLVVDGDNRYHAILGNEGPANFVNPSSLAPALIALGARVGIRGADGEREIELAELYRTPQAEGESELSLAHQELVTEILLPPAGPENATYEVRQKEALDWPLAAAAVALEVADGVIRQARVVLGHVAPTPYVADSASQALVGKALSVEAAEEAGRLAVEGAKALSGNGYKIQLARVAAKRAVLRAGGMEV
jgi:xanthine dehydrogenase YagS FAD-binding subunit